MTYNPFPVPQTHRIATTHARDQLPRLIHWVQHPRHVVILTRHGKDVAALVSMAEMKIIDRQQDITEDAARKTASFFTLGRGGFSTNAEAALHIREVQLNRLMERQVLARAGVEPVKGGELVEVGEEVVVEPRKRRWWWFW